MTSAITAVMNLPGLCVSIANTAVPSKLPALYPIHHIAVPLQQLHCWSRHDPALCVI